MRRIYLISEIGSGGSCFRLEQGEQARSSKDRAAVSKLRRTRAVQLITHDFLSAPDWYDSAPDCRDSEGDRPRENASRLFPKKQRQRRPKEALPCLDSCCRACSWVASCATESGASSVVLAAPQSDSKVNFQSFLWNTAAPLAPWPAQSATRPSCLYALPCSAATDARPALFKFAP